MKTKRLAAGLLTIATVVVMTLALLSAVAEGAMDLNEQDKKLHFAGSALVAHTIEWQLEKRCPDMGTLKRKAYTVGGTVAAGLIKEILWYAMDNNNEPCEEDMMANTAGAIAGVTLTWRW